MATIRWGTLPALLLAGLLGGGDATAAPANDECAGAIVIGAIPFTETRDVTGATSVITDPAFDCSDHSLGTPGVWYGYTAAAPISLLIDTFGSDYDTALRVYGGACGSETGPLDCNDNDYDNQDFIEESRVLVTLEAGETALIEVRNVNLPFGGNSLTLHVHETPVFRVTPFGQYQNRTPAIARSGDEFLVVWNESSFPDDTVFARRYDLSGIALSSGFQVSTSPLNYTLPDVAGSDAGFVVVWTANAGIVAQRFDPNGSPVGGEIPVSSYAYPLAVAAAPGGEFMVVWEDFDDGDDQGVFARAFDASGTAVGPTFLVNTYTTGRQIEADVTADGSGNFTVVWASGDDSPDGPAPDGDRLGVFGRRFDVTGIPLGPEFQVNTYTTDNQQYPAVAAAEDGTFTVVWGDSGDGNCFMCVDARRFDASGAPLGPPVRVADPTVDTTGFAEGPPFAVAADDSGGFAVVWPQVGGHMRVRRLDAAGTPIGSPFKVTHLSDGYQYHPDVATAPGGDFVVVWDWSPYGSKYDVMGRHVTPAESGICTTAPRDAGDCHQVTVPGKSKLNVRDRSPDTADAVTWKWVHGDDTALAELGDPLATHSYALCLYDAAGFKLEAAVGHGGTCGKPCWTSLGADGFRYVDKQGTRGPVRKLVIKPGTNGAAKVIAKVKGNALVMPTLPFVPPLRAQLQASNGSCWDVPYDGAGVTLNTPSDVKAVGPN